MVCECVQNGCSCHTGARKVSALHYLSSKFSLFDAGHDLVFLEELTQALR